MDPKSLHSKVFHFDRGDLWIEALVPGQEGLSAQDSFSFRASTIAEVQSFGPQASLIKLGSGREIVFDLPYTDLQKKIRESEDAVLDLKPVTNLTPRAKLVAKLRDDFKEAAERAQHAAFEALTFHAFVRTAKKTDFRAFTFSGKDVKPGRLSEGSSIMGGNYTKFEVRDPSRLGFPDGEFIMEIPLAEFQALVAEAAAKGRADLDLREISLRKGTEIPPEKRQAAGPQP